MGALFCSPLSGVARFCEDVTYLMLQGVIWYLEMHDTRLLTQRHSGCVCALPTEESG